MEMITPELEAAARALCLDTCTGCRVAGSVCHRPVENLGGQLRLARVVVAALTPTERMVDAVFALPDEETDDEREPPRVIFRTMCDAILGTAPATEEEGKIE